MTDQDYYSISNSRIFHQEHSSGGALSLSMTEGLTATTKLQKQETIQTIWCFSSL